MVTYLNSGQNFEKISAFPPLVEEVETTLPAFIGYTSKAAKKIKNDLILEPLRIKSMKEFVSYFGFPFENQIEVAVAKDVSNKFFITSLSEPALQYILYYSVSIYFANGGRNCYILSVGTYQNPQQVVLKKSPGSQNFGLLDGLNKLSDVEDLSLIVIPEAVKLSKTDYTSLVQATLMQCHQLDNRFAILDLYDGENCTPDLSLNRSFFGNNNLKYGSAYYPFIRTKMNSYVNAEGSNVKVNYAGEEVTLGKLKKINSLLYKFVKNELKYKYIDIPPCGAVTAAYINTDLNRGIWKSPANYNLVGVLEPLVHIDNHFQNSLHIDPDSGKYINSIRSFPNKRILVWGASTLAGKSDENQHVAVVRFLIMVKESLRKSTLWVVFEPNNENTCMKVRQMIRDYLTQKWQEGALAGITPQQAFFVNCELGLTTTTLDISERKMNIEVGLAILRPAEFITFSFSHQLQAAKPKIDM